MKKNYIPLRTKLYLLICFIVILALGSLSYQNISTTENLLKTQMTQRSLSLSETSLRSIENYFSSWKSQGDQILKSLTKKKLSEAKIFAAGLLDTSDDLLRIEVFRFFNFQVDSVLDIKSKKYPLKDNFYIDWIKKMGRKENMEPSYLIVQDKVSFFGICVPANAEDQSLFWSCLSIKKESLVTHLPSEDKTYAFILNNDMKFFLNQKKEFKNMNFFKKSLSGESETAILSSFKWSDNKLYSPTFGWSKRFKFSVVFVKDIGDSQKSIDISIRKTIVLTLIILIISIFIGYFSSGSLTLKLNQLSEITRSIASGNFSKRIALKSNDEIGILQDSINHMADEIHRLLHFSVEAAKKEKELLTAKAVQDTFFQRNFIKSDNLTTFGSYISADECGGDWWGYFKVSERIDLICIADATGHGAPAALVTAIAYSFFQTFSNLLTQEERLRISPGDLLTRLNNVFWEAGKGKTTMTFFLCLFDKLDGTLAYSNAGHNFPMIFPKDTQDERIKKRKTSSQDRFFSINQKGHPLGYESGIFYETKTMILKPGDKIFMYTDGLIECKNQKLEMWGKKNLVKSLNDIIDDHVENIPKKLMDKAYLFFEKKPIDDDITIVVVEYA